MGHTIVIVRDVEGGGCFTRGAGVVVYVDVGFEGRGNKWYNVGVKLLNGKDGNEEKKEDKGRGGEGGSGEGREEIL